VLDNELLPIPKEEGNFDDPAYVGPQRTMLEEIEISQPGGPSFSVDLSPVRHGVSSREYLVHDVTAIVRLACSCGKIRPVPPAGPRRPSK